MGTLHCLDVGCADASVIVLSTETFLVDCCNIDVHASLLPRSKRIRGVFITHQHRDHYSGLAYLKEKGYAIEHLVFSPYDRRQGDSSVTVEEWNEFNSLSQYFERQGAKLHRPFRQASWDKAWWKTNGVEFWIVGPAKSVASSATRKIHDASLVIKADLGLRHCCFAGDASDISLDDIAATTKHYCGDILHASHHGSLDGASLEFLKKADTQYTVISTKSGVYENVPHSTALERYRTYTAKEVYRTDNDGSVKWTF